MDGFIHSSSHSCIHPLTPAGEVSISSKRATEKIELSSLNSYLFFLFFQILFFLGPVPAGPEIGWCAQLIPLLKPDKQKEIQDFFEICTFDCFCLFPFGIRQTDKVLISLKRATGKTEGIDLGGEINFVCGERPA